MAGPFAWATAVAVSLQDVKSSMDLEWSRCLKSTMKRGDGSRPTRYAYVASWINTPKAAPEKEVKSGVSLGAEVKSGAEVESGVSLGVKAAPKKEVKAKAKSVVSAKDKPVKEKVADIRAKVAAVGAKVAVLEAKASAAKNKSVIKASAKDKSAAKSGVSLKAKATQLDPDFPESSSREDPRFRRLAKGMVDPPPLEPPPATRARAFGRSLASGSAFAIDDNDDIE